MARSSQDRSQDGEPGLEPGARIGARIAGARIEPDRARIGAMTPGIPFLL